MYKTHIFIPLFSVLTVNLSYQGCMYLEEGANSLLLPTMLPPLFAPVTGMHQKEDHCVLDGDKCIHFQTTSLLENSYSLNPALKVPYVTEEKNLSQICHHSCTLCEFWHISWLSLKPKS